MILRKAAVDIGQVRWWRGVKLERKEERRKAERGFPPERTECEKRDERERVSEITRVKDWQYFAFSSSPVYLPPVVCNFFGFARSLSN